MQYFGGKQRIAKKLSVFIQPYVNGASTYVEPFVGGAAMLAAIDSPIKIAGDLNPFLITLWKSLSKGWEPPSEITEQKYAEVKAAMREDDPLTAFVGFGCSFAGKWFGGYARGEEGRNYASNAAGSLKKKMKTLANVKWHFSDYASLPFPKGSVIYCDPPYQGTTQYGAVTSFNWERFWDWCRDQSMVGNKVFVSEYNAPKDFDCILEVKTKLDIRTKDGVQPPRIERLFSQ